MARHYGLLVIEDAAQAPGAMINGRRAGTWGDVGVLSFGGSKLLAAGSMMLFTAVKL
jgi:dTDP-4-amino-4,6-dideoxygalactose transaminase